MSKLKVMTGAERKAQLLAAGAKLATKHGAANVTRRMVAEACKCTEGLVNVYMGDRATAQKAYARKAIALGMALPTKANSDAIGVKMRSHGPRDKRDSRKRSVKEVEAIKRKSLGNANKGNSVDVKLATKDKALAARGTGSKRRETKPVVAPSRSQPSPGLAAPAPPERKTAARKPKAPPKHEAKEGPPLPRPALPLGSFP